MSDASHHDTTAKQRASAVVRILRGDATVAGVARELGVSPGAVAEWQRAFLAAGQGALSTSPTRGASPWTSPAMLVALAALALLWAALRVTYFNGYYTEDAPGYVTDAAYFALGRFHVRDYVNGLNVGTYLPVAVPLLLLGKSELALGLWPLLCSALGVAAMAASTARLVGARWGVLAAFLYVTYPGDVFFSTVVMPDSIQAGWLTASICLVVVAMTAPSRMAWLLAAGVAMGVCHLVRANGPLLLPIGLVAVALLHGGDGSGRSSGAVRLRALLAYAGGWLLVQVAEGLVYGITAGNVFHRFDVVNRHYGAMASIAQWGLNVDLTTIPHSLMPPLTWWRTGVWFALNQEQAYHGIVFTLAVLALVAGGAAWLAGRPAEARTRAAYLLGLFWFAWPLLYHEFGSQSLTQYVPIHRLSRHLVVYAPGAIFAIVAGAALLWRHDRVQTAPRVRTALQAAGGLALVLHVLLAVQGYRVSYRAFHDIKGTYQRVRNAIPADVRVVVGDPGDLCFLDFWMNPLGAEPVRMLPYDTVRSCADMPAGVVLTFTNPGWHGLSAPVIRDTIARLPCLLQPPATWRLLYTGYPERVFVSDGSTPRPVAAAMAPRSEAAGTTTASTTHAH